MKKKLVTFINIVWHFFSKKIVRIDVGNKVFWKATDKGHNVEFIAGPDGWKAPRKSKNGKEGLVIALSKNPDLIITDVMMPLMDGKEFCKVVKSNFETSHIPVIMITALSDIGDKVDGIKMGADTYLEKPFNVNVLNAYVHNLLNSREVLKKVTSNKTKDKFNSPDEKLISDFIMIVEQNMTNYNLSVDFLTEKIGLSKSSLFRKVKGLTGLSPNEFVTQIKMNHAAELLKNNKGVERRNEIALIYKNAFKNKSDS